MHFCFSIRAMEVDVLCVGDCLVDAFITLENADKHCHVNEDTCEICFEDGAKIPVDDCQFRIGGNACNVSVGLSRFGFKTALVAETGDDIFAQLITKELYKESVSLEFLKQTSHAPASFSISLKVMDDRIIFSRHVKRDHDIDFEKAKTEYVYLTSVGAEWKGLYKSVLQYVKDHNSTLAFNPGSIQLKEGKDSFITILQAADILFVNKEEAEGIVYGSEHITDELKQPENLLRELPKLGPKIISITDGDHGSYAIDETGKMYQQGILPGNFVQKTGVGDAYASAFLASLIYNRNNFQQALLWGAANAASVIEHIGSQPGLLTKEKLQERVQQV